MEKNYKNTLSLGKTDFEMRGNLKNKEPNFQKQWASKQIYRKRLEQNKAKPLFILHDGPPYANGDLHVGHALNKTLKDFIIRWKNSNGYQAPFIMGWDTHGLPIEIAISKSGVDRKSLNPVDFRELCREYALKQVVNQSQQFFRLGIFSDYDVKYTTLNHDYEMSELKLFSKMFKDGLIYKDFRPIYWSPSSQSALAESEIEYQNVKSPTIYVAFDLIDSKLFSKNTKLIIWTTTPWTIPVNQMVAVASDLIYVLVRPKNEDRKFIVAKALLKKVSEAIGWETVEIEKEFLGEELINSKYKHPLYPDRISKIVHGHHVTTDLGTGLVHVASGFGEDDYLIAKEHNEPIWAPINDLGEFTLEIGDDQLVGKFYEDTNKLITSRLLETEHLLKLKFQSHSYPHDWRTKKPVIYRATLQWFIGLKNVKERILSHVDKINTRPNWAKERLYQVLDDRTDWTISRQRLWGVPIIGFYDKENNLVLNSEILDYALIVLNEYGLNSWFEKSADFFLPEKYQNKNLTKEKDILDVWFDSGTSAIALENRFPEFKRPYDVYLEGNDQYRGWFNASMINSVIFDNKSPYKNLLSHGMTTDEKSRKMSKSLGNGIDPIAFANDLGADILRLWVASTDYTDDQKIGSDIIKQISETYRKIRNTMRFLLANLADFDPKTDYQTQLNEVDYYALHNLTKFKNSVIKAFDNYQFNTIYNLVINYVTNDLSSFYLDFIKDIVYVDAINSLRRRQVQTVLFEQLWALLDVLRPILVHTVEEVYLSLPSNFVNTESIHLLDIRKQDFIWESQKIKKWDQILQFKNDINKGLEKAKLSNIVSKTLESNVYFELKPEFADLAKELPKDLNQIFIISNLIAFQHDDSFQEEKMSWVKVTKNNGLKCQRCWIICDKLVDNNLCQRCFNVVNV